MAKATNLVKAYMSNAIPPEGGFIVSAFFLKGTTYGIYEVTAYRNVKDIFRSTDGINFKTDGNRAHTLVEPPIYPKKHIEPVNRENDRSIPYRFNELNIITGKKGEKIMISREPQLIHSAFTILEHEGDSFSFLFYPTEDVYVAIRKFLADSFYNDCNLTKPNAMDAAKAMLETIKKFTIWNS